MFEYEFQHNIFITFRQQNQVFWKVAIALEVYQINSQH